MKTEVYEPESCFLKDNESAGNLILDFLASRIMRKKFMLFISAPHPPPVYGILLQQSEWTKKVIVYEIKLSII